MKLDEAVRLLRGGREGIQEWNRRRSAREEVPSLRGVDLSGTDLANLIVTGKHPGAKTIGVTGAHLNDLELSDVDFTACNLSHIGFNNSVLSNADFTEANLSHASLSHCDLTGARFHGSILFQTEMSNADVTNATFGFSAVLVDFSRIKGLADTKHFAPSFLDLDDFLLRGGPNPAESAHVPPELFLVGAGFQQQTIDFIHQCSAQPIQFYSCFISYSSGDEKFATRLYNDFRVAGIRCWKWNHDARTGQALWGEIDAAIRIYDKLVLIASESSLRSPAVNREIERAIQKEDERELNKQQGMFDGDTNVLFPVRIDDFIFENWEHERKPDVTKKVVADARGWEEDETIYQRVRDRLIRDLKPE